MVPGRDEVDPELPGRLQRRLLGLAGDEEVVALVRRLDQVVAGGAGRDRDALDPLRPCANTSGPRSTARSIRPAAPRSPPAPRASHQADGPELALSLDAEQRGQLRVVAELGMRVEREVVGDEAQVGAEERLEPAAQSPVDDERLVAPEETVVDEHELRAGLGRPLEQLERGGDAARDLLDVRRADDLQPGTAEFGKPLDLQPLVRVGDDLVPAGHGRILGRVAEPGKPIPCPRSGCGAAW